MNDEDRTDATADKAGLDVLLTTLTLKATAARWAGGAFFAFGGLMTLRALLAAWILPEPWIAGAHSSPSPFGWIIGLPLAAVCFAESVYLFRFAIPVGSRCAARTSSTIGGLSPQCRPCGCRSAS